METISNAMMAFENHEYVEMEEAGTDADANIPSIREEKMAHNDFNALSVEAHTDDNNNKEYDGKGHEISDDDNKNNKMRFSTTNNATQKKQNRPNPNPTGEELLNHCCGSCVNCSGTLLIFPVLIFALCLASMPWFLLTFFYLEFATTYKDYNAQDDECDLSNRLEIYFGYCTFYFIWKMFDCITESDKCKKSVWYKRLKLLDGIIFVCLVCIGFWATVWIPAASTCPEQFPEYFAAARYMLYYNIASFLFVGLAMFATVVIVLLRGKSNTDGKKVSLGKIPTSDDASVITASTISQTDAKDTPLLSNSKDIEIGASKGKNQPEIADREEVQELGRE